MMRRIAKSLGIFTVCSLFSSISYGDDLFEILQLALDNDPTLQQAEATYRANHENVIQSRASLLPTFGVGGRTSRITAGPTDSSFIARTDPATGETVSVFQPEHSFRPGINNHGWGVSLNQSVVNLANWYNLQSARASDRAAAGWWGVDK